MIVVFVFACVLGGEEVCRGAVSCWNPGLLVMGLVGS